MSGARFFLGLYLAVLVLLDGTTFNVADPDLWHRLAVGEYTWQHGSFPGPEVFSYRTDRLDGLDHELGSALIFYRVYAALGDPGIVLLKLFVLGSIVGLMAAAPGRLGARATGWTAGFFALAILVLLPSFQSTLRSGVFTHLFLAFWIYLWACEESGRARSWWLYPMTMLVWANLHGGFLLGFAWLGALLLLDWRAGRPTGPRLRVLGVCFLASLVNFLGWKVWISVYQGLTIRRTAMHEWEPVAWLSPDSFWAYKGFFLLVLVLASLHVWQRGKQQAEWKNLALLGLWGAFSLTAYRQTSFLALVAGAIIPGLWERTPFPAPPRAGPRQRRDPLARLGRFFWQATLVISPLFLAISAPHDGLRLQYLPESCPSRAVDFLRQSGTRGRLLVPFNYGSYALWHLRGAWRVSIDGRYDILYTQANIEAQARFFEAKQLAPDWDRNLGCDAILVPRAAPIYPKLKQSSAWREVYLDVTDAVFLPR